MSKYAVELKRRLRNREPFGQISDWYLECLYSEDLYLKDLSLLELKFFVAVFEKWVQQRRLQ